MSNTRMQRVVFQPNAYRGMLHGVNQIVGAIRPTLGPRPRVVAMDSITFGCKTPDFLDDGGSIARRIIQLGDRDADVGAMFVREVLWRLQNEVGDGTATAAVLFQAVLKQGVRYLAAGGNATLLHKNLHKGLQVILDELNYMTIPVAGRKELARVAESICYDPDMAKLMGEIFDVVGEYGRVEIRSGRTRNLEREYVEGMYWDWGVHSGSMLNATHGKRVEMENAAILISDMEINDPAQLFPPIALAIEAKIPALLIIAEHLSEKVIGFLLSNTNPQKIVVTAVKTPGWDKEQKAAALSDLAVLTGGRPFIQVAGNTFLNIKLSDFGRVRRVWADAMNFGFVGGKGDARRLRQHIATLRAAFKRNDDLIARDHLRARIGKLLGGSATLWVGGITERDIEARRELAERTATAMRGAMQEGILPGGGVALLTCRPALERKLCETTDVDERAAYQILIQAVAEPFRAIMTNAGYDASEILAELSHSDPGYGFDLSTEKFVDMLQAGVADPAYVQKSAVYAAIASAALALTVDVMVHHARPEKAELPEPARKKHL